VARERNFRVLVNFGEVVVFQPQLGPGATTGWIADTFSVFC